MSLGKSLLRNQKSKAKQRKSNYQLALEVREHVAEQQIAAEAQRRLAEAKGLKSVWNTSNLDDLLAEADAREQGYTAQRGVRVVVGGAVHIVQHDRVVPLSDNSKDWLKLSEQLEIPHRPKWDFEQSSTDIEKQERSAFIDWRRTLAKIEENEKVVLTPYEKNLEVWRQLWRVVERSDLILYIVDARNPLVFRSRDFEQYVARHTTKKGEQKPIILLLNKADLLTEQQRIAWAAYLKRQNIAFFFFSAKVATTKQQEVALQMLAEREEARNRPSLTSSLAHERGLIAQGEDEDDDSDEEDDLPAEPAADPSKTAPKETNNAKNSKRAKRKLRGGPQQLNKFPSQLAGYAGNAQPKAAPSAAAASAHKKHLHQDPTQEMKERDERVAALAAKPAEPHEILSPEALLDRLALLKPSTGVSADEAIMVGMVGYPNVGKSSTINAILGCKKVVVSATPGKTKHFQTLSIPNEHRVQLCDCPGLVFPSFAATRETMVCDGMLPIDNVKDFATPVAVVCRRVPRYVLEHKYRVNLDWKEDQDESSSKSDLLLNLAARRKGFLADHGRPNRARAAKIILKEYVDGDLIFSHPPPGLNVKAPREMDEALEAALIAKRKAALALAKEGGDEGDEAKRKPKKQPTTAAVAAPANNDGDEEWEDDDDDDEGDEWESISDAEDQRRLSDDDKDASDEESEDDPTAALDFIPIFWDRRENQHTLTSSEAFNSERNADYLDVIEEEMAKADRDRLKRRAANPQHEEDVTVRVSKTGEKQLVLDSDDDIVFEGGPANANSYVPAFGGPTNAGKPPKKVSKRQARRQEKRQGASVPANTTTRKVAIQGV